MPQGLDDAQAGGFEAGEEGADLEGGLEAQGHEEVDGGHQVDVQLCLLYTSPSPRD